MPRRNLSATEQKGMRHYPGQQRARSGERSSKTAGSALAVQCRSPVLRFNGKELITYASLCLRFEEGAIFPTYQRASSFPVKRSRLGSHYSSTCMKACGTQAAPEYKLTVFLWPVAQCACVGIRPSCILHDTIHFSCLLLARQTVCISKQFTLMPL